MDKLIVENYLFELQVLKEIELINEDISSFMKTFNPSKFSKIFSSIKNALQNKNIQKAIKAFSNVKLPIVSLDKLKMVGKKISPEFNRNYMLSKKVLQNSLPEKISNSKAVDLAAITITTKVIAKKIDIKSELKDFIIKFRRNYNDSDLINKLRVPPELKEEAVLGYTVIVMVVGIIGLGGVGLSLLTGTFWAPFAVLIVIFIFSWWKNIEKEAKEKEET